jgi:hypothetical protein
VYDLAADSKERRNLISDAKYAGFAAQSRQRLAAWRAFQNRYIEHLGTLATAHR